MADRPKVPDDEDSELSVDNLILRNTGTHYRKVAMVVGMVLCERLGLKDVEIAERVKVLVASGKLEAQGDLDYMRESEVRLPSR